LGDWHRDFFEDLRKLLDGGVPIAEALATLDAESEGRAAKLANRLSEGLRAGDTVAEALEAYDRRARPEDIALVAAGELSGTLDLALGIVVREMDRRRELWSLLWSGSAYPLLLLVLAVVLPPIYLLVSGNASTYFSIVAAFFLPLAAIALLIWQGHRVLPRGSERREFLERAFFKVPWAGDLVLERGVGRSFRLLALLHQAGLPLGEAIAHAAQAAGLDSVRAELLAVEPRLLAGKTLAESFRDLPVLGARASWSSRIAVGEKTGGLEKALGELGNTLEDRVQRKLLLLVRVLPIFVFLAVGALVLVQAVKAFSTLRGNL
jgi:general secretion pathway protein F